MRQAKFEIKKAKNNQFMFNLKAGNGEIILTSEAYIKKSGCENGINSVKENASDDNNYERKDAVNGQYYFNLRAKNSKVIGKSEMYNSAQGRDNGIKSVKTNAPNAKVEDFT